jgi:hypothetical protein
MAGSSPGAVAVPTKPPLAAAVPIAEPIRAANTTIMITMINGLLNNLGSFRKNR